MKELKEEKTGSIEDILLPTGLAPPQIRIPEFRFRNTRISPDGTWLPGPGVPGVPGYLVCHVYLVYLVYLVCLVFLVYLVYLGIMCIFVCIPVSRYRCT